MAHIAGSRSRVTMPCWGQASIVVWAWRYGSAPLASGRSTSTTLKGLFAASSARSPASITSYGGAATASSEPTAERSYRRVRSGCTSAMRAATLAPRAVSVAEGAGVGALGHVGEPLRPAPQEEREEHDPPEADDPERDVDRRAEPLERLPAVVRRQAEDQRPDDPARRVGDQEAAPFHLPDAGEEGRVRAQDRHEAAEEHDLAAVPVEHVARDLDVRLADAHLVAVL